MIAENILMPIRVFVTDEQRLCREAICSLLSLNKEILVVGSSDTIQESLEMTFLLDPEVFLVGLYRVLPENLSIIHQIKMRLPCCQVLVLAAREDDCCAVDLLQAGAAGLLLKDLPSTALIQAIQLTYHGISLWQGSLLSQCIKELLKPKSMVPPMRSMMPHTNNAPLSLPFMQEVDQLTEREVDVLRLLANGASNREIASQLVISERTVKNHVSNILSRLGVRDRTQAALYARDQLTLH